MDKISAILFQDAQQRIIKEATKIASTDISNDLLIDAETHIQSIKEAALSKESMALHPAKDLKNSSANVQWSVEAPTGRTQKIAQDIYDAFSPYFFKVGKSGKREPIQVGAHFPKGKINLPSEKPSFSGEPTSTVRIEFRFQRHVVPIQTEFAQNAERALAEVEKSLPGFQQFINALESYNIPVLPYFHATFRTPQYGGFTNKEMTEFISQQGNDTAQFDPSTVPASKRFYQYHLMQMRLGKPLLQTMSYPHYRLYSRNEIFQIDSHTTLLKAIAFKIGQGYWLDSRGLWEHVKRMRNEMIRRQMGPQTNMGGARQGLNQYRAYYVEYYNKIINALNQGLQPFGEGEDAKQFYEWGTDLLNQQQLRGLRVVGKSGGEIKTRTKNMVSADLNLEQLQLALYYLTEHYPENQQVKNVIDPEFFVVPNKKTAYQNNGWDSSPAWDDSVMPLIPAMRKDADGNMIYDYDQGNLGGTHLANNGTGIKKLLFTLDAAIGGNWGQWCEKSLKHLQDPSENAVSSWNQKDQPFAFDAWANVIGNANRYGNRTNAETFLESISKFPKWEDFQKNILQHSLASNYTGSANRVKSTKGFNAGQIDQFDFEELKKYGYAISKMMDFVYALMSRCCEEQFDNRVSTRHEPMTENFYGRTYSSSQGTSEYGKIVLGIKYAFNAPELGSSDPQLLNLVRKQRYQQHLKRPGEAGDIFRRTQHFQKGQPVDDRLQDPIRKVFVKVMEDMKFWVGVSSSQSRFLKTVGRDIKNWTDALDVIRTQFPQIGNSLGVVFAPMHMNIEEISKSAKKMLTKITEELNSQSEQQMEVIFIDHNQSIDILDPDIQAAAEQIESQPANPADYADADQPPIDYSQYDVPQQQEDYGNVPIYDSGQDLATYEHEYPYEEQSQPPILNAPQKEQQEKISGYQMRFDQGNETIPQENNAPDILMKLSKKLEQIGQPELAQKLLIVLNHYVG